MDAPTQPLGLKFIGRTLEQEVVGSIPTKSILLLTNVFEFSIIKRIVQWNELNLQ